jgi:hypothetical protein
MESWGQQKSVWLLFCSIQPCFSLDKYQSDGSIANNLLELSVYDIVVSIIAILLISFFFNTAWKQARLLSRMGE